MSVMVVLVRVILTGTMGSLRFAERIRWTWRGLFRPKHLRTSLIVAGVLFLFFGLISGLYLGLNGQNVELSFEPISGLNIGLSLGLSYWLLLGLYQGMKQEHLEDQDRQQFNQGIRHSLRNGLLITLMSALLIGAIGVLSQVLIIVGYMGIYLATNIEASGMAYRMSPDMIVRLSYEQLLLLFPGIVVMWALSGGLTVLRHYVIRWLLARHHLFPWRAQAFLNDATSRVLLRRVGGGYSFIHRRLQDYFADAATPLSQNERGGET